MGFFSMKNSFKIVSVIIGTLIGAGFASGQEMYLFFFSYGIKGSLGIIISSLLMGYIISRSLKMIQSENINNYKDFVEKLFPIKRENSYFNVKYILNGIINCFILITFFIMIAGFGAYLEQEYGIHHLLGSSILAMLCFFLFLTNVKGLIKTNEILIPTIIVILIFIRTS